MSQGENAEIEEARVRYSLFRSHSGIFIHIHPTQNRKWLSRPKSSDHSWRDTQNWSTSWPPNPTTKCGTRTSSWTSTWGRPFGFGVGSDKRHLKWSKMSTAIDTINKYLSVHDLCVRAWSVCACVRAGFWTTRMVPRRRRSPSWMSGWNKQWAGAVSTGKCFSNEVESTCGVRKIWN